MDEDSMDGDLSWEERRAKERGERRKRQQGYRDLCAAVATLLPPIYDPLTAEEHRWSLKGSKEQDDSDLWHSSRAYAEAGPWEMGFAPAEVGWKKGHQGQVRIHMSLQGELSDYIPRDVIDSINVRIDRGPGTIAREIERRLLPLWDQALEHALPKYAEAVAAAAELERVIQEIQQHTEEAYTEDDYRRNNTKDRLDERERRLRSGDYCARTLIQLELSTYGPMVKIEACFPLTVAAESAIALWHIVRSHNDRVAQDRGAREEGGPRAYTREEEERILTRLLGGSPPPPAEEGSRFEFDDPCMEGFD